MTTEDKGARGGWAGITVDGFPLAEVFGYLDDVRDRLRVAQVCRKWRMATSTLWRELDLCCVKEDVPRWLQYVSFHRNRFANLQRIKIEFCNTMCDADLTHLHGFSNVTSLILNACQELTSEGIAHLLPSFPKLSELQVYWNLNITDDLLFSISAYIPHLQRLNLSGCKGIRNDGVKILAASCPGITELNITRCINLSDSAIASIATGLKLLRSLNCYACSWITDASLRDLGGGCQDLEALDICGASQVTDGGLRYLTQSCHNLKVLNLSWCVLLTDKAVTAIAEGSRSLELLSLHGITRITDGAVDALAQSCAASLTALDVNGCTAMQKYATRQSLRDKLPALSCFVIHT